MHAKSMHKQYIEESSFSEDPPIKGEYRSNIKQLQRKPKKPVVFKDDEDEPSDEFKQSRPTAGIGKRLANSPQHVPEYAAHRVRATPSPQDEDEFSEPPGGLKVARLAKQIEQLSVLQKAQTAPKSIPAPQPPAPAPKPTAIIKPEEYLPTSKGTRNPAPVIDYTQCKSSVIDLEEFKPSKRFWRVLGDLKPVLMENIHSEQADRLTLMGKIGTESLRHKDDPNKSDCAFIRLEFSQFASDYWKRHFDQKWVYVVDVPSRQAKIQDKAHQVTVYIEVPSELQLGSENFFTKAQLHLDTTRTNTTITKSLELKRLNHQEITAQVKDIKSKSPSGKFCYIRDIAELSYFVLNCTGCRDPRNPEDRVFRDKFRVLGVVSDLSSEFNLYNDDLEGRRKLQFDDSSGSVEFLLRGTEVKLPKSALDRPVSLEITLEVDYLLKQSYLLCEDPKILTSDKDLALLSKEPV